MNELKELLYIRASQLKDLYTPKKILKNGDLSKIGGIRSAKCKEILSQIIHRYDYNIWTTNAMVKGTEIEEEAVNFAKWFTGEKDITYITKEAEDSSLRNVHKWPLRGTADIVSGNSIIDIKTAYNWHSFDTTSEEDLLSDYERQMRAYMYLYGKQKAYIFYILTKTPDWIIADEERKLFYKSNSRWINMEDPDFLEKCKEMAKIFNVDGVGIYERVKIVEIEHDVEKEEEMLYYIDQAIQYMISYYNKLKDKAELNKEIFLKNL